MSGSGSGKELQGSGKELQAQPVPSLRQARRSPSPIAAFLHAIGDQLEHTPLLEDKSLLGPLDPPGPIASVLRDLAAQAADTLGSIDHPLHAVASRLERTSRLDPGPIAVVASVLRKLALEAQLASSPRPAVGDYDYEGLTGRLNVMLEMVRRSLDPDLPEPVFVKSSTENEDEGNDDDVIWLAVADAWSRGLNELHTLKSDLELLNLSLESRAGE